MRMPSRMPSSSSIIRIRFLFSTYGCLLLPDDIISERTRCNYKELLNARPTYEKTEYKITGVSDYQKELKATVEIYFRNDTVFKKDVYLKNDIDYGALEDVAISNNIITFKPNLDSEIIKNIRIVTKDNSYDLDLDANSFTIPYPRTLEKDIIKVQLIAIDNSITDEIELEYFIKAEDIVFVNAIIRVTIGDEIIIPLKDIYGNDVPFETEFDDNFVEEKDGKLYGIKVGETAIIIKAAGNESFATIVINEKGYVVTYDFNGGEVIMGPETVKETKDLIMFQLGRGPRKDGFRFEGWYLDKELTKEFNFEEYVLNSDITLYAKWIEVEEEKENSGCNKASIINLMFLLMTSFGTCFIIKKKH